MKVAYFGGGSFRVLPEVREVLSHEIGQKLEVALYDLNRERGEAMAALIRKCPEYQGTGANIVYTNKLDQALAGADFAEMTACPWSGPAYGASCATCNDFGWTGSDNISINGAFLAARGIPIVLNIARRLEKLSPKATMICFTNPIAILASAVNRHTNIRAVGYCGGMGNHFHNISYMMKWPDYNWDLVAECAGINHFSWIQSLKLHGKDFLPAVDRVMRKGIDWEWLKRISNYSYLRYQLAREVYCWTTFGAMLYSSEPDGIIHLAFYDEELAMQTAGRKKAVKPRKPAPRLSKHGWKPNPVVQEFIKLSKADLPPEAWETPVPGWASTPYPLLTKGPYTSNGPVRLMRAFQGHSEEAFAASYFNNGAIEGFPDKAVMEYTCVFSKKGIGHKRTYKMPPATVGVTQSLVEHQTLIADSIATNDRRMFLQSLYAYPMCRSKSKAEAFMDRMIEINRAELPKFLQ